MSFAHPSSWRSAVETEDRDETDPETSWHQSSSCLTSDLRKGPPRWKVVWTVLYYREVQTRPSPRISSLMKDEYLCTLEVTLVVTVYIYRSSTRNNVLSIDWSGDERIRAGEGVKGSPYLQSVWSSQEVIGSSWPVLSKYGINQSRSLYL